MTTPPHGPARVRKPLSTAILIAPRPYYSRFPPLLQERNWPGCALHIKAALRDQLGAAFCVSGMLPRAGPLHLPGAAASQFQRGLYRLSGSVETRGRSQFVGTLGRSSIAVFRICNTVGADIIRPLLKRLPPVVRGRVIPAPTGALPTFLVIAVIFPIYPLPL